MQTNIKYVNVYPKFAFSFRLNSEHRRAKNHERVALVYFSAQLTMIFHPITTMSCIKLIWLSPLLIPFFCLLISTFSLVFPHSKYNNGRLRHRIFIFDDDTLGWCTSVDLCCLKRFSALVAKYTLHVCNTRFHCLCGFSPLKFWLKQMFSFTKN